MRTDAAPTPAARLRAQLAAAPLRTERLLLRLPRADDAPRVYHGYAYDLDAIRWLSFLPHATTTTTEAVLAGWMSDWERGAGELMLVIERAEDGAFLGVIGLEPAGTAVSVGYVLCRPAWGRGYATEAVRCVVDLAFAHFGAWRVWATCAVQNVASRRVLEKAGMRHEGVLRRWAVSPLHSPDPRDSHCLAVTRDDWLARQAAGAASSTGPNRGFEPTPDVVLRVLGPADLDAYLALRREALTSAPLAFGESVEEHDARNVEHERARLAADDADTYVLGAFVGDRLLGMAGITRGPRRKSWHRAAIWGVYVAADLRGRGVGRRLVEELLARAARRPGLEAVWLTVTSTQAAARATYRTLGFVPFGVARRAILVGERYVDEEYLEVPLHPPPEPR